MNPAQWTAWLLVLAFAGAAPRPALARPGAKAAPKPVPKAVWGIDVSHHQGRIRWDQLQGQGLSFVYIKATEGDYMADPTFLENWQGAARAGLARGAYHFFDLCGRGAPQADQFIKLVPRSPGSLPPAIDLEPSPGCARLPSRKTLLRELAAYSRKVRSRYGKAPVLYLDYKMYDRYLKGQKHGYALWIPYYKDRPALSDGRAWTFWQISNKATLRGINGPVDVDLFRGSAAQFVFLGKPVPSLFAQR
ncbi:MAG: GH25 family lysozyme [Elusimicrobia bacterium]|nr:GH25 family lysozyme [Elusimicrobiota bacterium]